MFYQLEYIMGLILVFLFQTLITLTRKKKKKEGEFH